MDTNPFAEKDTFSRKKRIIIESGLTAFIVIFMTIVLIASPRMKKALLIVDVQNDYCEGGAIPVKDCEAVIPKINKLKNRRRYSAVVLIQDWHPANHVSFISSHPGRRPGDVITVGGTEVELWTDHCVQGTEGAEFHPDLNIDSDDIVIRVGTDPDIVCHSGFCGKRVSDQKLLLNILEKADISRVHVVGVGLEYSVANTAIDAVDTFDTSLFKDLSPYYSKEAADEVIELLSDEGVNV